MEGLFILGPMQRIRADIVNGFFLNIHQGAELRRGQAGGSKVRKWH